MPANKQYKKLVRDSLDLLYKIQNFRGLSFNDSFETIEQKNESANDIIKSLENLNKEFSNTRLLSNSIKNFKKLIKTPLVLNTYSFIEYTNIIIIPILHSVEHLLKEYKNIKELQIYIQLIKTIEQVAFQRGLLSLSAYHNGISNEFVYNILQNYNELISLIGHTQKITLDNRLLIQKKHFLLSKNEYFEILSNYINQLIVLENDYLNKFFEFQDKISIDVESHGKIKSILQKQLDDYYINILLAHGKVSKLNKKNHLPKSNKHYLYICISGMIKSYLIDDDGGESIIDLFDEGDFFYTNFFMPEITLESLTNDTKLFYIQTDVLETLIYSYPELKMFFYNVLINFILEKNIYISNLVSKKVKSRLASFLVEQKDESADFKFGKYNIARYLNMSPETFSRILKDLDKEKKQDDAYLCRYCSEHLSEKCENKNIKKCVYSDN